MQTPTVEVDPDREQAELEQYLGDAYDHSLLQQYENTLEHEVEGHEGDEASFYRTSRAYLYNLTAFAMTATKQPYLEELTRLVPTGSRVLDYGCGIGSDGLALLEAGYEVEFADFDNPSVAYLRWRLEHRGLSAPIHDLDQSVPGGFDAAYSFDVIEHVPDPFAFLGELEARAALIVVNFLEPVPGETELHHELPVKALVDHAASMRLASYAVHHERSHLVAYSPEKGGLAGRLGGRAKVAAVRLGGRFAGSEPPR